jgi:hypothetical protein
MSEKPKFRRVECSHAETAYAVEVNGEQVGFVWSRRGFSYRGTQGWNRGIRIRDFHPLEWHYGQKVGLRERHSYGRYSRESAVQALLDLKGATP